MIKLKEYSQQFHVRDKIKPILSDISDVHIPDCYFDLIFSVYSLEHLDSESTFDHVVERIIEGTKSQGINCLIISTNIKETILDTGESLDPMYQLIFDTHYLIDKFESMYDGWKLLKHTIKPYSVEIMRDDRRILLESEVLTWVVQKNIWIAKRR